MATVAVGDVHGQLAPLHDLLAQLQPELHDGDVLVFVGDYIDRGPDSRACIDAILDFTGRTPATVVGLRGNHEDWMLRSLADPSRHSWLMGMDGLVTVRSYSIDAEQAIRDAMAAAGAQLFAGKCTLPYEAFFEAMPASHRAFFDQLALVLETADCICSHGGLDPRIAALGDQPAKSLIWGGGTFPDGYQGDLPVVYGHWHNAELDAGGWPHPRMVGNTIGIDTIAHGVLTAIRLPDRRVFQSARYASASVE